MKSRKMSINSIFTLFIVVISLTLLGCGNNRKTSKDETPLTSKDSAAISGEKILKIGAVLMQTGPASQAGLAYARGYQVMVDKVNESGGLKIGNDIYKIDLTVADDAMSTEQAAIATTKLVEQDGCTIIFGSLTSSMMLVEYPITSEAGVLLMNCGCPVSGKYQYEHQSDVTPDKPLYIRTQHTYSDVIPGLLDYLQEKYPEVRTIALDGITEGTTEILITVVKNEMEDRGLVQAGEFETFAPDIQDYAPIMTRVLMSKPDAIFCINGGPTALGSQTKSARELGFKGPIFTLVKGDIELQAKIAGSKTTDIFAHGFTLTDDEHLTKGLIDFKELFLEKYSKDELVGDAVYAYQNMWTIIQAIQKADSIEPAAIEAAFENMKEPGNIQSVFGSTAHSGGLETLGVNRVIVEPYAISVVTNGISKIDRWLTYEFP